MSERLRVLYLEDDPDFTNLVSTMLADEGLPAEISLVADSPTFNAALETNGFDIILADYSLPTWNGLQALEAALKKCPHIPFLLVSGTIGEQAAIESLKCGATDYVLKSRLDRLVPAVRRAVLEARERAQLRHAESELVRREKYFQALTENSLDVLAILNRRAVFEYNSPSLKSVLGYDPGELRGRCIFELVHAEDRSSVQQAFEQALNDPNCRVTVQFRIEHRDGTWRHLEAVGQNRLEDPEIAGLVVNVRDIGDRKRAEAEVRESEHQYRLIFEANPIPMWISDLETGRFLEVNSAAVQHYGYTREEFLAMTTDDIISSEESARMSQFLGNLLKNQSASGIGRGGMWQHRTSNGTSIDVEITWSLITSRGRQALVTMANDITERRRNERREAGLSRLSRGLSSATSPEQAAHMIKDVADDLFGWDCFALGLCVPGSDILSPVLKIETVNGVRQEVQLERLGDSPTPIVKRVLQHGAQLVLESAPTPAGATDLFGSKSNPAPSQILVPVRNGTKVIGLLSIQSHTPNAYDQQDLNALQILADHCAGALERIHAEQAFRESERRFGELFEGSPDAIVVADLDAKILDVNPAACRLWGLGHSELLGRNLTSLAQLHLERDILSNLGKLAAGAMGQSEGVSRTADGREIPVEVNGNCISYGDQQAVLLHLRDITERRQVAEALRKSEASLAAAQRIACLGSWELDLTDGENIHENQLRWSDETYRIFGLEPRQVPISTSLFFEFVHPDDRQRVREATDQAFQTRGVYDTEHRIILANGEERIVRERAELALDPSGEPIQMRGIVMDITERKRLEEQLRQSQKMEAIGQLAGGVAHDFNNILTVIHGHTSLLLYNKELPTPVTNSARQIAQSVERAAGLTRQLLAFSRRQVMQPRRLDLNEVVSNMTMMLGRILGEDITLQLNYWPQPAPIHADASMIEQVLLNLAVNARDAMPKGGRLAIKITLTSVDRRHLSYHPEARTGDFVCLSVVDNGCGIAPENLRRIFEPFFTTKAVGKGTGLGLATVYGIVKQHQGWIEVDSEPGKGAAFRVYLPASKEVDQPAEASPIEEAVRGGHETVLVVEDETPVRELVCAVLENYGYSVLRADSGAKAIETWRQNAQKVDLLLTDLVMPDRINGRELAEQLQAEQPSLKVIFTSGYSADVVGRDFVLQHGLHYLQKPYDSQKLAGMVRECLDAGASG